MTTKDETTNHIAWIIPLLAGTALCAVFLAQPIEAQETNAGSDSFFPLVPSSTHIRCDAPDEQHAAKTGIPIPSGTILPVRLNSSLSSVKSKPGQVITGRIEQEIPLSSGSKIRRGSKVVGHVVSVSPATAGTGSQISFQFDELVSSHQRTPIATNLRAIAGFMEVLDAQTPKTGPDRGTPSNWQTTTQIGGDVVYGLGGPVTTAENAQEVVGTGVDSGVLSRVTAKQGTRCRGVIDGNSAPQALWVFSSDACGTYGLEHLHISHAGRSDPTGLIVLSSDTVRLAVPSGTGILLRVNRTSK